MAITLISDSLCDLTEELIKEWDVKILPLSVTFADDDKVYDDGKDITPDMIYKHVDEKKVLPKTSAVTIEKFYNAFKEELDKGNQVFYVGAGSGISSTYQNALAAKEELNSNDIEISDSMTLSTGIGLLVHKARKYIDEGKSLKEIKSLIDNHALNSSVKFSIDIMDYLYLGGRCGGLSRFFGSLLHIHPIIKVVDNKLIVASKPRGKYEKAMDEQIKMFNEDLKHIDTDCLFITHSGPETSKDYEYIYNKLKSKFPEKNIHITRAGSTVSSHCGPRTIGILYLLK